MLVVLGIFLGLLGAGFVFVGLRTNSMGDILIGVGLAMIAGSCF